jgi:hypothetical protein
MAKKSAKKKVVKKKVSVKKKLTVKNTSKPEIKQIRATPSRLRLVLRNLILFAILATISYVLYVVSKGVVYETFFYFLAMILGFISLAFLISFLVLIFLRLLRK